MSLENGLTFYVIIIIIDRKDDLDVQLTLIKPNPNCTQFKASLELVKFNLHREELPFTRKLLGRLQKKVFNWRKSPVYLQGRFGIYLLNPGAQWHVLHSRCNKSMIATGAIFLSSSSLNFNMHLCRYTGAFSADSSTGTIDMSGTSVGFRGLI